VPEAGCSLLAVTDAEPRRCVRGCRRRRRGSGSITGKIPGFAHFVSVWHRHPAAVVFTSRADFLL